MDTQTDFWGEIAPAEVRTPAAIMREQAALLGAKTRYLIEAVVETEVSGSRFIHRFNLVVPAMDNYKYELFKVYHGVSIYPVTEYGESKMLKTEEEFSDWLRGVLSSPATKKLVGNLLVQVSS